MRHRSQFSVRRRRLHSRLISLLHRGPLMKAATYVLRNTCGKPNCKCATGDKHETPYVARTREGKRQARSIPKELRDEVPKWIERYEEIEKLLEELSVEAWQELAKGHRKTQSR